MSSRPNVRHIWKYLKVQNLRNLAKWGSKNIWKRILESSENQTCINVSPYVVMATEHGSHFHSSYTVLAVMNHLGIMCAL